MGHKKQSFVMGLPSHCYVDKQKCTTHTTIKVDEELWLCIDLVHGCAVTYTVVPRLSR